MCVEPYYGKSLTIIVFEEGWSEIRLIYLLEVEYGLVVLMNLLITDGNGEMDTVIMFGFGEHIQGRCLRFEVEESNTFEGVSVGEGVGGILGYNIVTDLNYGSIIMIFESIVA